MLNLLADFGPTLKTDYSLPVVFKGTVINHNLPFQCRVNLTYHIFVGMLGWKQGWP